MQETRLCRTETRSREGCQEFLGIVRMCWELVNREWTVWMPARLLQSLCRWKRCFFLGSLFLGDQNLRSLQRNVSGWRYRVLQLFHTIYDDVIYYIPISVTSQFLQSRGTKTEWTVHQTNFSRVVKNGLGTIQVVTTIRTVLTAKTAWPLCKMEPQLISPCSQSSSAGLPLTFKFWPDNIRKKVKRPHPFLSVWVKMPSLSC